MSKSGHFWQWNRLLIITRTNGDCPGHTRIYSCPTYTSLQREIVTLILVDIFTLCKCDSFPWVDKSKFHGIGEDRGVPNPPVTHSQILKLHLLVKKKKDSSSPILYANTRTSQHDPTSHTSKLPTLWKCALNVSKPSKCWGEKHGLHREPENERLHTWNS